MYCVFYVAFLSTVFPDQSFRTTSFLNNIFADSVIVLQANLLFELWQFLPHMQKCIKLIKWLIDWFYECFRTMNEIITSNYNLTTINYNKGVKYNSHIHTGRLRYPLFRIVSKIKQNEEADWEELTCILLELLCIVQKLFYTEEKRFKKIKNSIKF